jgi:hypothetical protein
MYAITDTVEDEVVDPRVRAFGDSCVLLLNQEEFFKRLRFSMMQEGLTGRATLVEYYDYDTYAGPVGPFRKSDAFAYQSEYRIVVRPGLRGPRKLFLGNIEDITSEIIPTSEINGRLKFREVDAREAGLIP